MYRPWSPGTTSLVTVQLQCVEIITSGNMLDLKRTYEGVLQWLGCGGIDTVEWPDCHGHTRASLGRDLLSQLQSAFCRTLRA